MKRIIQKIIFLTAFAVLLSSCAVIRRGCSCTAQTQKTLKKASDNTFKEDVNIFNVRKALK